MSGYPRPPPPPRNNRFAAPPPPRQQQQQQQQQTPPGGFAARPPPPPMSAPTPTSSSARSTGFATPPPPPPSPQHVGSAPPHNNSSSGAVPPPPAFGAGRPPPPPTMHPPPPNQFQQQQQQQPQPPSSGPPAYPSHNSFVGNHAGPGFAQTQPPPPPPPQNNQMDRGRTPPLPPAPPGVGYPPGAFPPQQQQYQQQHQQQPGYPPVQSQGYPPQPQGQHAQGQYGSGGGGGRAPPPIPLSSIDPSKMPRVPLFTRPDDPVPVYYPRSALERASAGDGSATGLLPPPADSRFWVQDDGNASPEMLRATLYQMPEHRGVWHQTGDLPMGVVCTPLAVPAADAVARPRVMPDGSLEDWQHPQAVPILDSLTARGGTPPPRCGSCHAYANPFFEESGVCNMCNKWNRSWPADQGRLAYQYGTVEWAVDGPYIGRETPVEMVHLYAIDLTSPRLPDYLPVLAALGDDVAAHAARQSPPWKPRLGLCFVCSAGIYLRKNDASADSPSPTYVVASDVTEDPFCPLPLSEWTWDLSSDQGVAQWETFLQNVTGELDALYNLAKARNVYGHDGLMLSCGGAALQFLAHALESTGGRGTWISWRRPNYGAGKIPHRDEKSNGMRFQGTYACSTPLQIQKNATGEDKESADFYSRLAEKCVESQVCLDVVYHTNPDGPTAFLDMATVGELCRQTCGRLMWIRAADWEEPLREELSHATQSFVGYDAVFKVRTSQGLQVKAYLGNPGSLLEDGGLVASEELNLSCVTPATCIAVQLEHSVGGIKKGKWAYIQAALLYSTPAGQRRVRVSTLALRSTADVAQVFRSVDLSATTLILTRYCVDRLRQTKDDSGDLEKIRPKAREGLYHMCVLMLANYRKNTNALISPLNQLLLPEKMQLLPLFCMGLMKSPMLRPSMARRIGGSQQVTISPTPDERAFAVACSQNSGLATSLLLAHPTLFDLQNNESEGNGIHWVPSASGSETAGIVRLPQPLSASVESMEDYGVYLVDCYDSLYLIFGKDVDSATKESFLDPSSETGKRVQLAVWQARALSSCLQGCESSNTIRSNFPPVVPVFRSEGRQTYMEARTLDLMVDDAIGGEKDYKDFLVNMHRRITERVESAK